MGYDVLSERVVPPTVVCPASAGAMSMRMAGVVLIHSVHPGSPPTVLCFPIVAPSAKGVTGNLIHAMALKDAPLFISKFKTSPHETRSFVTTPCSLKFTHSRDWIDRPEYRPLRKPDLRDALRRLLTYGPIPF